MSNNFRNKFILIGLGNPGKKYVSTRHNAGKILAAWLKAEGRRSKDEGSRIPAEFEIVETDCFMNRSGEWLRKKLKSYGLWVVGYGSSREGEGESATSPSSSPDSQLTTHNSQLFVAHDDLDLPLGSFKIHFGRGPRLHQGILSIEQALGTKEFWRVRIGIDNRLSVAVAKPGTYSSGGVKRKLLTIPASPPQTSNDSETGLANTTVKRFPIPASQTQPPARTIKRLSGEDYVLQPFQRAEKLILNRTFGLIKLALLEYVTKSVRSDVCND